MSDDLPHGGRADHFIAGAWRPPSSARYVSAEDPSTGLPLGEVAVGTSEDARAAVDAAVAVEERWGFTPAHERARLLRAVSARLTADREGLARLIAREVGKPIGEARTEADRASEVFAYAAEECRLLTGETFPADAYARPAGNEHRLLYTVRDPIGVVVAISPFNFPLNLLSHKVAPALAAGNPVVAKPTRAAPFIALRLAEHLHAAGVPAGAFNVVIGPGSAVGDALIDHPATRLVTFTGSTDVGTAIAERAARGAKRTILEMGGLDPFIVFADAPLERTVRDALRGAFAFSGQVCTASKRFLVERSIADRFGAAFARGAAALRVGPALEEETQVGPVIDGASVDRLTAIVADAKERSATILTGGSADRGRPGHFFAPTVLDRVPPEARVAREEPFGPLAPILRFDGEEEAIRLANGTPYGLQASVYTQDLSRALSMARRLRAGGVHVNDPTTLRWDALPFGGVKMSGLGREGLHEAMREMTELKMVSVNFAPVG
jgi:acyl-CoA reductase-like NAD-dependent aldehyde dehydrogenase